MVDNGNRGERQRIEAYNNETMKMKQAQLKDIR